MTDNVVDVCACLTPFRADPEDLAILLQFVLGEADGIHKRWAGPSLLLLGLIQMSLLKRGGGFGVNIAGGALGRSSNVRCG